MQKAVEQGDIVAFMSAWDDIQGAMPSPRRRFLLGTATLPLLAGCTGFGEPAFEVVELEVVFANGQDEPLTFEFAVETEDGVGEWSAYEVEAGEGRTVTVEPPAGEVVGVRATVDGYNASGEIRRYDADEACPRFVVDYDLAETPTILQSVDVSC